MHFSFAFRDCTRVRGLKVNEISYDEWQDFDPAFEPIINETMSGSKEVGIIQYTGTPKTTDGPLETKWLQSSQTLMIKNGLPRNRILPVEYSHFLQGPLFRLKMRS